MITFIIHDLHQPLPFDEGTFDIVVSGLVLEHLHDLNQFFAQVQRVLKPGGKAILSAMHPAMFLRGSQARFTDPHSGEVIQPGSVQHSISDFIMAALGTGSDGLRLSTISEHSPDAAFAAQYPRSEKYLNWPMLVVMQFSK